MIDPDQIRATYLGTELPLPTPTADIKRRAMRLRQRQRLVLSTAAVSIALLAVVIARGLGSSPHQVRITPVGPVGSLPVQPGPPATTTAPILRSNWPSTTLSVNDVGSLATVGEQLYVEVIPPANSEIVHRSAVVERIDPAGGKVLATSASFPGGELVTSGSGLWLFATTNATGSWAASAYQLNPSDLAIERTIALPVQASTTIGLVSAGANATSIWFSTGKIVGRLDPVSGAITSQTTVVDGTVPWVAVDDKDHAFLLDSTTALVSPTGLAHVEALEQRDATTGTEEATTNTDDDLSFLSAGTTNGVWAIESSQEPPSNGGVVQRVAVVFVDAGSLRFEPVTAPVPTTGQGLQPAGPSTGISGGVVWFNVGGTLGCASTRTHAVLAEDQSLTRSTLSAVAVGGSLFVPNVDGGLVRLTPPAACQPGP